jgi:hypothetical protein
MSTRIRCAANPATMIRNDAPAIAVKRSKPPEIWAIDTMIAAAKAR